MTRVSVIIPIFNAGKTIKNTLDSVLRQTHTDCEVIIVDDGSTDAPEDVIRQVMPSAAIIKQNNKGAMAARQAGIDAATGDIIAWLDGDDTWFPQMLKTELDVLENHPEVGLVLANMKAVNDEGKELGFNVVPVEKCYSPSWEEILLLHPFVTSTALFRRKTVIGIGGLDTSFGFSGALGDSDTFTRMGWFTRVHFINECLGCYRWSEYRPGRLISFLTNLEVYAKKYLNHPRLSGADGFELRAKFAQACSGYSLHICRMLTSHEVGNIPPSLRQSIEGHQKAMLRLFGDVYQSRVATNGRALAMLGRLTGSLLPAGSSRRRPFAPFLNAGRILITEGPASLGRKAFHRVRPQRSRPDSEEDIPALAVTPGMRSSRKTKVLVIDDYIPAIRYGAGFPRLYKMLTCLADLGHATTFFPVGNPVKVQPETSELQQKGIEVFWGNKVNFQEFAQARLGYYDAVLVSRPQVFRRIYPKIVRSWPKAAVLYDAEALFYARDIVQAEIAGKALRESQKTEIAREEMQLIEKADVVISVSQRTKEIMLENSSQRNIEVWEHIQDVSGSDAPYARRQDLLHFGSFFAGPGSPNEDAVLYFVREVLPEVRRSLSCKLYVVGTSPTPAVMKLAAPDIEVVGYVDEPKTYFDMCRVNVVPTRIFATGTPLKLIEAMASGIPSVVNGPISRHLGLIDGKDVLVADSSKEFAAKIVQLYSDEMLWNRLMQNSIRYVNDNYSYAKMRQRLDSAIRLGLEIKSRKA